MATCDVVTLPASGIVVLVSEDYHDERPGDDRLALPPDIPVEVTWEDYVAGRDPVLEAALSTDSATRPRVAYLAQEVERMRIVVTGGSGKGGTWVVRDLARPATTCSTWTRATTAARHGECLVADLTDLGQTRTR